MEFCSEDPALMHMSAVVNVGGSNDYNGISLLQQPCRSAQCSDDYCFPPVHCTIIASSLPPNFNSMCLIYALWREKVHTSNTSDLLRAEGADDRRTNTEEANYAMQVSFICILLK